MAPTPHTAPSHSDSGRLPLFSQVRQPLTSKCFYREFNEAGDGGDEGGDGGEGGDEGGEGDKGSGDKGDGGSGSGSGSEAGDKNKGSETEGRISELVKKNNELQDQLKEYEKAKKQQEDEKLKKDGKLQELLDSKETELADATSAREALQKKVDTYEEMAEKQIKTALEAIEDEEQREAAEAMLKGRETVDQYSLLPQVLKLAGKSADSSVGGQTPVGTQKTGQRSNEQKQARFQELVGKGEELTPKERAERNDLMSELQQDAWDA